MKIESDIQYAGKSQSQKLDLYFPDELSGKNLPLILYIHGGGFSGGDKAKGKALCFGKSNHPNFIVACVNYRLSGEAGFPAGIEDCENALRFLIKNAKKYGIDPTRVAIMGSSAGGNYALMLGLNQKLMQLFKKVCIVVLYPVTDLLSHKEFAESLEDDNPLKSYLIENSEIYFKKHFSDISDDDLKNASPYHLLTSTLPCTLLQHGTADDIAPLSQSQSFYEKALKMGVDIEFDVFQGAEHSDKMFEKESNLKRIFDFISLKLEPHMKDISFFVDDERFNFRVAAYVTCEDKMLLQNTDTVDYWNLVGGRVHLGENTVDAICREVKEEIGADAKKPKLMVVAENFFEWQDRKVHEMLFIYKIEVGKKYLSLLEGSNVLDHRDQHLKWVEKSKIKTQTCKPIIIYDLPKLEKNENISHVVNNALPTKA